MYRNRRYGYARTPHGHDKDESMAKSCHMEFRAAEIRSRLVSQTMLERPRPPRFRHRNRPRRRNRQMKLVKHDVKRIKDEDTKPSSMPALFLFKITLNNNSAYNTADSVARLCEIGVQSDSGQTAPKKEGIRVVSTTVSLEKCRFYSRRPSPGK